MSVYHVEAVRCSICGAFLFNTMAELPFEIASTGAMLMKMSVDITCGHCHKEGVYALLPKFAVDKV